MKIMIRYETKDGKSFTSEHVAKKWEAMIDECAAAIAPLGNLEPGRGGEGYIQDDPAVVLKVKSRLMRIAAEMDSHPVFKMDPAAVHPMSIAGRILSEYGDHPLALAWNRLCRIDDQAREWEQPYFALNPGTGKNVRLNP